MALSIIEILRQGPIGSKELRSRTGLSQATISRQLSALGDQVVRLGSGRATQYAMSKNAFGAGNIIPLYATDPHGNDVRIAIIRPLAHGGYYVERTTGTPSVLLGQNGDGLYDDLPYFLDDLRPQGFLGRQIAETLSESSRFPPDPRNWTTNHIGSYLVANGDDLPGNLQIGDQVQMRIPREVTVTKRKDYPSMAESVLKGKIPGSSAGGEQPKFTVLTEDRDHAIVKFSPIGDDPVAQRWRDILLTEYHAERVLRDSPARAVNCNIHNIGGRLFLESQRFDRHGDIGRMPMVSLMAIDAEFVGLGSNWPDVMAALVELNLARVEHLNDTRLLYQFGRLIHNTDMHLGNLSLAYDSDVFRLLPVYDMCSMGFAPRSGEVTPYNFRIEVTIRDNSSYTNFASSLAIKFWDELAADERISNELREFLERGNPVSIN